MMYKNEYVLSGGDANSEDTAFVLPMRLYEDHQVVQQYQNFPCNSATIKVSELNIEIAKSVILLFSENTAYLLFGTYSVLFIIPISKLKLPCINLLAIVFSTYICNKWMNKTLKF